MSHPLTIKTALLVDDSKIARLALSRLLEKADVEVDLCATGQEALHQLQTNHHPDVIFVDQLMPDMSGEELVIAIKSNPATAMIPVIMCSSKITSSLQATANKIGVNELLRTPPQSDSVLAILKKLSHHAERGETAGKAAEVPAEPENKSSDDEVAVNEPAPRSNNKSIAKDPEEFGHAIVDLTIDSIEKAAKAAIETNLNTRVHELLSDLFDEQYLLIKRLADHVQGELETSLSGAQEQLDQRIRLLKEQFLAELTLTLRQQVSQQFKDLKNELQYSQPAAGLSSEQLEELKDHITSLQSIDTEFWQISQAEAIQRAHETSRESAESIAKHTIRLYAQSRRRNDIKSYLIAAALGLTVICFSFAYFSGMMG